MKDGTLVQDVGSQVSTLANKVTQHAFFYLIYASVDDFKTMLPVNCSQRCKSGDFWKFTGKFFLITVILVFVIVKCIMW